MHNILNRIIFVTEKLFITNTNQVLWCNWSALRTLNPVIRVQVSVGPNFISFNSHDNLTSAKCFTALSNNQRFNILTFTMRMQKWQLWDFEFRPPKRMGLIKLPHATCQLSSTNKIVYHKAKPKLVF